MVLSVAVEGRRADLVDAEGVVVVVVVEAEVGAEAGAAVEAEVPAVVAAGVHRSGRGRGPRRMGPLARRRWEHHCSRSMLLGILLRRRFEPGRRNKEKTTLANSIYTRIACERNDHGPLCPLHLQDLPLPLPPADHPPSTPCFRPPASSHEAGEEAA